jgi:flagellar protein FlaF
MEAAKCEPTDVRGRIDALDWNRRMWSVLGTACSDPGNALPDQLRASIISLSIWVGKHTSQVIRRQEEIEPLIEVNRMVMQGLRGPGQATPAAA